MAVQTINDDKVVVTSSKAVVKENEGESKKVSLQQSAFLVALDHQIAPLFTEQSATKEIPLKRTELFPSADEVMRVLIDRDLINASSVEELDTKLVAYLKEEQGFDEEEAEKAISIFRKYFTIFGADLLDIHGKILEVGVIGLQVDSKAMRIVQDSLSKLRDEISNAVETQQHHGAKSGYLMMGVVMGSMLIGGGVGAGIAKSATAKVAAGGAALGKGTLFAAKYGAKVMVPLVTAPTLAVALPVTIKHGAIDKGPSSPDRDLHTVEQTILARQGELISQQIGVKNTTEVGKSSQDTNNLMPLLNATLKTMQEAFRI